MKDDIAALLLEHETDDPIPADHELRIRAGLSTLLATGGAAPAHDGGSQATPAKPPSGEAPTHTPVLSATAQGAAVKVTTALLVGIGIAAGGFALGRATAPASTAPVTVPSTTQGTPTATEAAPSPSASALSNAGSAPSAESSAPVPSPSASTTSNVAATSAGSGSAFDREQSLLERARSALVRHDAAAAEQALDTCERQFPRSRHAEERDYLRIQVLRERGDSASVRERARTFLAKYPDSLLRARVEPLAR